MKKKVSTSKDLYVNDIAFEATEEDLHKLFALCGRVRAIHMVKDAGGRFKGCAFVHMSSAAEARDALVTLDGVSLHHRCISVTEALPRKTTPPAGTAPAAPAKKPAKPGPRRPKQ